MSHNFSRKFKLPNQAYEFLDIPTNEEDILAFIDPFLIEKNKSDIFIKKVSQRLQEFLRELNNSYIKINDYKNGIPFLNHLHEPNEFHLGYSSSNKGKAISKSKSEEIFYALRGNRFASQAFSITNEAHNVLLLVKGIGQDIMSDIISNVCRDIFSEFTVSICTKYMISNEYLKNVTIEYYNSKSKKWDTKKVKLPFINSKIILLPADILSGKREYSSRYNWFISKNYLSKEVLENKRPSNSKMVTEMKDGTKKAIIKEIYNQYRKPKDELIEFVLQYPNSLDEFMEYAKVHYPKLNLDNLK
ncbi:hypothetical protein [Psychroflexus tropicus]|uniref:hypothetical protein n=1 Tax=Psychroflexus tropicus TaxID=197345 RepID=UPI000380C9DF|nr:hypothetical protein [Psychroflexus tropicus]